MQLPSHLVRVLACAVLAVTRSPATAADTRAVVTRVSPEYPPMAEQMHLYGEIKLLVSVSVEGKVTSVQVTSGHPILAVAAVAAVNRWRFAPAAEPSQVTVSVSFKQPLN